MSTNDNLNKVKIGRYSGFSGQGSNAIAIGYKAGYNNQPDNSIVINATGSEFSPSVSNGLYVAPIRPIGTTPSYTLGYNNSTNEILYYTTGGGGGGNTLDVSNVATLKALDVTSITNGSLIRTAGYYTQNDGGQATYVYNSSSTLLDNSGTILQPNTGSGRYLLLHQTDIYPEWFGARGDGSSNDYLPLQNAIDYCYNLCDPSSNLYKVGCNGMNVKLGGKVYGISSQLLMKKNVNFVGNTSEQIFVEPSVGKFTGSLTASSSIKALSNFTDPSGTPNIMVTIFPDRSSSINAQNGLNRKNSPQITIKYILFDGNNVANTGLYVYECWGIEVCYCYFDRFNGNGYALWTYDNNSAVFKSNTVRGGWLSDNDSDTKIIENDLAAVCSPASQKELQAICINSMVNSLVQHNFPFGSGAPPTNNTLSFSITDISSTGIITANSLQNLLIGPTASSSNAIATYAPSNTYTIQPLVVDISASSSGTAFITIAGTNCISGNTYGLTGTVFMSNASASTTRNIRFQTGNGTGTYINSLTVNRGNTVSFNATYTHSSGGTNPLRITFITVGSGDDIFRFNVSVVTTIDNTALTNSLTSMNQKIVVLDYDTTDASNTTFNNLYNPTKSFYIKWITRNTFYLYDAVTGLGNLPYVNNTFLSGVSGTPKNMTVGYSRGCLSMIGNCNHITVGNNRIEDTFEIGIYMRNCHYITLTGNYSHKATIPQSYGLYLQYGVVNCIFSGNFIGMGDYYDINDKLGQAIYIDKYSYNNKFVGNQIGPSRSGLDIEDNYVGDNAEMNFYSNETYKKAFIKYNKPTDYILDNSGVFISNQTDLSSGGIVSTQRTRCAIWADNFPVINDQEYTMYFKDICFYDNSGIIIYEQDVSSGTSSRNRIQILKQPTTNFIQISISGETVYQSTTGVTRGLLYDMIIDKDLSANYDIILNNTTLAKTTISDVSRNFNYLNPPTNTMSSIGSFRSDISSNPSNAQFSLTGFKYYEDMLSDAELSTLTAYNRLNNNTTRINDNTNWKLLLDISAATEATKATYISFGTNMTYSFSATSSINLNPLNGNQTLIMTSTGGTNANNIALNIPTDTTGIANNTLRISFWARSLDLNNVNCIEFQVSPTTSKIVNLTDTYKRYVVYIQPDINQFIRGGILYIRLGIESKSIVGLLNSGKYQFSNGTVYIAGLKVYQGNSPLFVDLNLINRQYDGYINKTVVNQPFYSTATLGRPEEYRMNVTNPPAQGFYYRGDKVYTSQYLNSTIGGNPLLGWQRITTGSNYNDWREIKGG